VKKLLPLIVLGPLLASCGNEYESPKPPDWAGVAEEIGDWPPGDDIEVVTLR
jgi:hypothetical protein